MGAKGCPRPNQASLHSLHHPTFPLRAVLTLGPGLSRDGMAAGGMYCMGMFLGKAHATRNWVPSWGALDGWEQLLSLLEVSVGLRFSLRPLSHHSWLCLQADISLHPQSRTQSRRVPGVCAFECWWAGLGMGFEPPLL